jgi:hypothetical protein
MDWRMAAAALLLMCSAALIAGCQQLGLAQPQTLNEKIAVTVASVTAVRQSTATLLQAGKISPADAQNVQTQADNVVAAAQIARTIAPTDPSAADAKLQSAIQILTALQTYLASKQGGK